MWSIDAMIRDESSGYGWGNGMMYVKGNEGASYFIGFGEFPIDQVLWKTCHSL